MSKIPDSYLQSLRDRTDIVDVVGKRVQLRKAGQNYGGLCPFHSEKTPSFTVSPVKQFYHCFGCGAHGDAIAFVMETDGLDFAEAVESLAQVCGLPLPVVEPSSQEEKQKQARREAILDALDAANKHFRASLRNAEQAVAYAKQRGLTGVTAQKFQIGFADGTLRAALHGFSEDVLIDAGLFGVGEDGEGVYEKFRSRLMFPIHDVKGCVIGFGGRVLGDAKPKYLNSPETAVFIKGNELYGLHHAKQAIRQGRVAVLLEGYMDVVMLAQHGEDRAVAALGTSLTEEQIRRLYRMADEIVLCFDGDKAGRSAAERAARLILPELRDGKTARFVTLPAEHDPDSFVQEFGIDAWRTYLTEQGVPLSEKVLNIVADGKNLALAEHKAAVAKAAAALLETITAAPIFECALRSHIETQIKMRLPKRKGPRAQAESVHQGRAVWNGHAVDPEKEGFYTNLALLCGMDAGALERVPAELLDDFAGLLSDWFAVAPLDGDERQAAIHAMPPSPIRTYLITAVVRAEEKKRYLNEDAQQREIEALLDAMSRTVRRLQRRSEVQSLFGGE